MDSVKGLVRMVMYPQGWYIVSGPRWQIPTNPIVALVDAECLR